MIKEVETNKIRKFEVKIGDTIYYVVVDFDEVKEWCEFYITKENSAVIYFQIGYHCTYADTPNEINKHIVEWVCDYENAINKTEDDYE